jgi:hypothetical protein
LKKKIIGILVCTLLIATTATISLGDTTTPDNVNIIEDEIEEVTIQAVRITEDGSIIPIPKTDPFIACMEACLAIGGLAGNCLWVILGCAAVPNPLNPCCLAIPVLCGIDIGLFFGCLARCTSIGDLPSSQPAEPCIPSHVSKLIKIINNPENPQQPLLFIGLLCLLRRLEDIENWLVSHGYDVPQDFNHFSIVKNMQNQKINLNTGDCGC